MSIAAFIPLVGKALDLIFPDPNKAAEAKLKLFEMEQSGQLKELESAAAIVNSEAKSEHWLTANWRPLTMLTFVFIIANNYILTPYVLMFFDVDVSLELPPDMWDLLKLGISGYVIGRSAEKTAKAWKEKNAD